MKPDKCKGCPLYEVGQGYVEGEGPDDAKVLLIGEALGAEEVREGRPFVGGAGRTLNFLLQKAGVRRSELAVTNICRCKPPRNRTPTEAEAAYCIKAHELRAYMKQFNFVVLLGNTALTAITGKKGISKWRGSVFMSVDAKVMPTLHPAAIMRVQEMIPAAVSDLMKIKQEGWTDEYTEPKADYQLDAHTGHWVGIIQNEPKAIAFDLETTSLEPSPGSIYLLGMTDKSCEAYVFSQEGSFKGEWREYLRDTFGSKDIVKIAHNLPFDRRHMEVNGVPVKPPYFDTMVAHHLILSDTPNDLGFVASMHTRLPYWKDQAKVRPRWYNARDTDAAFRIYETLEPQIRFYKMERIFETSMRALGVLEKMHVRGVRVDRDLQLKWRVALSRKIRKLEADLQSAIHDSLFNWQSPIQLAKLLYDRLGLPRQYSKSGSVTTQEEALKDLYEMTHSPIVATVMSLRKLGKLESTYFSASDMINGRVHSEYPLHVASTGRMASRGPNLQNVPKGPARKIYIPDEGEEFTMADYNQIEFRIMAQLAGEQEILEAFERGEDIHTRMGATLYHVRMSEVTPKQRFKAKMTVYGLGYGRGARSIAKQYGMTTSEAQRLIDEFFSRFLRIKALREEWANTGKREGYLVNPFMRRRYFFGPSLVPRMYNFIPQSTALDVMLEALVDLDEELPSPAHLVLTVHDNVLVAHPPEMRKQVAECLKDVMEKPIDVLGGYRVPIDISHGKDWGETDMK